MSKMFLFLALLLISGFVFGQPSMKRKAHFTRAEVFQINGDKFMRHQNSEKTVIDILAGVEFWKKASIHDTSLIDSLYSLIVQARKKSMLLKPGKTPITSRQQEGQEWIRPTKDTVIFDNLIEKGFPSYKIKLIDSHKNRVFEAIIFSNFDSPLTFVVLDGYAYLSSAALKNRIESLLVPVFFEGFTMYERHSKIK